MSLLRHPRAVTVALLLGNLAVGLAANFCFKEGGTDAAHRWQYFVAGNVCGITSTALLMGLYARLHANLVLVFATSGAFLLMQLSFWLVYHTRLTLLQVAGIAMVGLGTLLASRPARALATEAAR